MPQNKAYLLDEMCLLSEFIYGQMNGVTFLVTSGHSASPMLSTKYSTLLMLEAQI